MDRDGWVNHFADAMMNLGVKAQREQIEALAGELYASRGQEDPGAAAQAEWDAWPPHDD